MLDQPLAYLSRRIGKLRGASRVVNVLRRYYASRYAGRADAWAVINDYDGTLSFKLDRSAYMGSAIYWLGYHHISEHLAIMPFLKPDAVFIDIGANTGEFALIAAKRLARGQVLAFEPFPPMFHILEENVALNRFRNVRLFPCGLGQTPSVVPFYGADDHSLHIGTHEGLTTMYASATRAKIVGQGDIRRFDDIAAEQQLARLDSMKIDVEGAELPVLQGAIKSLRRFHPAVLIEINEEMFQAAGYTTADLMTFMQDLGYRPWFIQRHGRLEAAHNSKIPPLCNILFKVVT